MSGREARCRSCGAPIIWVVTENGRRIPLDADSERRFVIRDSIQAKGPRLALVRPTYQTHFATCPQADQWRKDGGAGDADPDSPPQRET